MFRNFAPTNQSINTMSKQEKLVNYAVLITNQIAGIFDKDCENHIDLNELTDSDNAKAFFHALSTAAPASLYNKLTGEDNSALEFNHVANHLCFEFCKTDGE